MYFIQLIWLSAMVKGVLGGAEPEKKDVKKQQ
jgi:hypothetical protein